MIRPEPKKHDICEGCLEHATLLMPVAFAPNWPVIVWQRLCLECRMSATSDEYMWLATDIQHNKRANAREAYHKWLQVEVD